MGTVASFFRLEPSRRDENSSLDEATPAMPDDLAAKLRPRDGIVCARWDEFDQLGVVEALGVVTGGGGGRSVEVDWRHADITLRPNPQGRHHWATKKFFPFAPAVVERYMLADLFAEHVPDLESLPFQPAPRASSTRPRSAAAAIPGYVYVLHSKYGCKIGKTVNLRDRTQLFGVKLPFPWTLYHYAWFEDYTDAERTFHQMFKDKRLDGEWFTLDDQDLATIKTYGELRPVAGIPLPTDNTAPEPRR